MSKKKRISDDSITVKQNKLPIILTCPHDGKEKPKDIDIRKPSNYPPDCNDPFQLSRDLNTRKITKGIAENISRLCKNEKGVYFEIGRIKRDRCDLNRRRKCAYEVHQAKDFYDEYHNSILRKIKDIQIQNTGKNSLSFVFDIHGMKDSKKSDCKVFIGTDCGNGISRLLELNPNALFDKNGFIKLLIEKGIPTCPSKKDDPEDPNFDGGYTIKKYGSSGHGFQALQIEITYSIRRNESERKKFEEDVAECILKFCGQYI